MRTKLFHLALIALAVAAVFGRSVTADLLSWDDEDLITANPHVADGNLPGLAWHWTHPHEGLYIPVVYSAWWSIAATAGVNPPFFHAANLIVYIACCWLVYALLLRLIARPWPAFAGAMLFALHPLQVEPVAWATGMKDLLCTFFSLAALAFYLRPRGYPAATLCFALAMLCKPAAVTLPLVAAIIDGILLHRPFRQTAMRLGPWLLGAIAIALITAHVQPVPNLRVGPFWARPLLAADAIDWYLFKLVYPVGLAIDYGHMPLRVLSWNIFSIPWISLAWIIPALIVAMLVYLRRPILTAAALIFAAALLPVLGFQPFNFQRYSTVADRYADFALLGPALAAAWLITKCRGRAVLWICLLILLTLAALSFVQTGYWQTDLTLYRRAIAINPDSAMAHNNLSVALYRRGDHAAAAVEYEIVMRLAPDQPDAYVNMANFQLDAAITYQNGGNLAAARRAYQSAISLFERALQLDPPNTDALNGLAEARRRLSKM